MSKISDEDKRKLKQYMTANLANLIISILRTRKETHIASWQANLNEQISADKRGRANEDDELISIFENINKV